MTTYPAVLPEGGVLGKGRPSLVIHQLNPEQHWLSCQITDDIIAKPKLSAHLSKPGLVLRPGPGEVDVARHSATPLYHLNRQEHSSFPLNHIYRPSSTISPHVTESVSDPFKIVDTTHATLIPLTQLPTARSIRGKSRSGLFVYNFSSWLHGISNGQSSC